MKKPSLLLVSLLAAAAPVHRATADLYWDLNLTAAGAGSNPTGTWDASAANWNVDPDGLASPGVWTPGDTAVFSAGNDATGPFTVNISGTQTAAGINIQEGTVAFAAGTASVGTGVISIAAGSTLSINSSTRIGGTAGAKVTLNGGTLLQTNPANALSFIPAAIDLEIGPAGGTVNYTTSGIGAVSIYGATTGTTGKIIGTGTLTKTGSGEFRYQGVGLPLTTYTKLVVNEGLFRLGFSATVQDERGFGAVPAVFTPDAITLNGGSIGQSFNVVLDSKRGITLGPAGGIFNTSAGSMTVPGVITGSGNLTNAGAGTAALILAGANTYTGTTTVTGGTLTLGAATIASGSILSTPSVAVVNSAFSLNNTAGNADRVGDATPVALRVATMSLTGNAIADTTEATGVLTLDSGRSIVTVASAAGRITTLAPASISRGTQNATALVRGTNLSQSTGTNVARIIPGDAGASLNLVGTNTLNNAGPSDATQAVKIVPYLFGDTSTTGTGNGFVTYDTTLGLRVLTSAQMTPLTASYVTAASPDNAAVTSDLALTGATGVTVNSLLFSGTAASTLSSTNPTLLTVNSGAVATTGAFDYAIDGSFSGLALGNGEGVVTVTSNILTIGTPISVSNNGGLTKAGTGTLVLNAVNTYTGPTTITAGVLEMQNAAAISTNTVRINGARLAVAPDATLSNAIIIGPNNGVAGRGLIEPVSGTATLTGPITIESNALAGGHFSAPVGTLLAIAGVITAPPSVTVTSRLGNVILSGGGTGYTNLQIQADTVSVGATNGIATTAIVDIASSATGTLDLNGFNQTLAGIAKTSNTAGRDATVQNFGAPATLTLNVAGQVAFSGTVAIAITNAGAARIIGDISLVKNGVGTQTLSGDGVNSYTGSTTINAGILKLQKAVNVDAIPFGGSVAINAGGTLQLGQSSQINDDVTSFVINAGTFDLGAFIEGVTPAVAITNGTITGTTAGFLLARGGYLANGTNTINKSISARGADPDSGLFNVFSGTTTVNGVIQTDDATVQGITKTGAGTLILSRTNTYTGDTTVTAGALEFRASQTLTSLTIGNGATVRLAQTAAAAAPMDEDFGGLGESASLADAAVTGAEPVQAVPEPGALSMLAAGLLGFLGRPRRRALL